MPIGIALWTAAVGFGCAESTSAPSSERPWLTARFALTGAQCVEHENQDTQFPSNADRVVARVSGFADPSLPPVTQTIPAGSQNAAGEVVIGQLPEGDDLLLELSACSGAVSTWTGVSRGLKVEVGLETYADVFLTPIDQVACLGEPGDAEQLPSPHMFAASAPVDERSVWIIGGFAAYDDDASERRLDAGDWVSVYDVPAASVSAVARLEAPRAMAAATQLPDGRTLVAGGTSGIRLLAAGQPPLWPALNEVPTPAVEVLTPGQASSVAGPEVVLPDLPACTGMGGGQILCAGGIEPNGELSKNAWVIGLTDVTTFQFPDGRYGATVISSRDGSGALIWGGHIGAPPGNAAVWVSLTDPPSAQPLVLSPSLGAGAAVPLFGSGVALPSLNDQEQRFVVLGGSDAADGTLPHSPTAHTARATLVSVNPLSGTAKLEEIDLGELEINTETANNIRRFGAQLVPLADDRIWLMGGVTAFAWDVACEVDNPCFQRDSVVFRLETGAGAGGSGLLLAEDESFDLEMGPFGMTGVSLYDGSWLVLGGMQSVTEQPFISVDAALIRHRSGGDDLCAADLEPAE